MLSAPVDPGGARTNNSHTRAGSVHRVPGGRPGGDRAGGQSWAAMALALSTSGPGSGTKMVRR